MIVKKRLFIALVACVLGSNSVYAQTVHSVIEAVAEEYSVDKKVLLAVITHESGDPSNGWEINPFAVNLGGFSYYPKTKKDAYQQVLTAMISGEKTIGLGIGQIEWRFHSQKFTHLWEAFDVEKNAKVTAEYLKEMIDRCKGDVWCGVGAYHNQNSPIGQVYAQKVKERWISL